MSRFVLSLLFVISNFALAEAPAKKEDATKPAASDKKTYAVMDTYMGKIKLLLYADKAPNTVANFVGLAEGSKEWTDPKTHKKVKRPLYNGTVFHRIVDGFMIQGGDPLGNSTGGPGYVFDNETRPDLKHDKPGILAMANSGPNTNGSQFYITVAPRESLDGHYTVFGEVTEGMDIVNKIDKVKVQVNPATGEMSQPVKPVILKSVKIERI